MLKTTKKHIKSLVESGVAIDVTTADPDNKKISVNERIFFSLSSEGCINGLIFSDYNNQLYAVTARSANLFRYL